MRFASGFAAATVSELRMKLLSQVALGSAQFGLRYGVTNTGDRVSEAESQAILSAAWQHGVHTLDTASAYGDSEEVLGRHGVSDWQVVSKLPPLPDPVEDVTRWVLASTVSALKRLKLNRLHGLLLHRPQQLLGPRGRELLIALREVQQSGLVEKIGVSIYAPDELPPLMDLHTFDLVQAPGSIIDRRLHESGWAKRLHLAGVEAHTRSAYLQGLLLSPSVQKQRFAHWNAVWAFWHRWLQEHQLSALQACVRYALAQPGVDKMVFGFDTVEQLHALAQAARGPLPALPEWPDLDPRLLNPSLWTAQ